MSTEFPPVLNIWKAKILRVGELAAAAEAREREASIQHPSGFVVPCVAFTLHDAQISFGQADMEREKLEQAEQEGTFFEILCRNCMGVSKNRGTPKWMVYNGKPY